MASWKCVGKPRLHVTEVYESYSDIFLSSLFILEMALFAKYVKKKFSVILFSMQNENKTPTAFNC